MDNITRINKQLDKIQTALLKQLKTTNIEDIDLMTYTNRVNNLKAKKDYLVLKDSNKKLLKQYGLI